ncbi:HPr kinase/phosphatase C-terminal domain-containing protein [Microvirga sp. W0021]|uniref:HPr kinase/phosphatase C-terminal domain-containing protein n=1 Tax=Hohaiivirga grylli TaxID=3133970 RepID=A0ABV0BK86_9HYPH
MKPERSTIHANCILIDDIGVLIRGNTGSGKSTVSRKLIAAAQASSMFGCLVSDDRTRLEVQHGRLIARPVEMISGLIEIRGVGIVKVPSEEAAVIRLVIDLTEQAPRMPEEGAETVNLLGVKLPHLVWLKNDDIASYILDVVKGTATGADGVHIDFKRLL